MAPVLEARQLAKTYESGGAKVLGLRGVDIAIERGEFRGHSLDLHAP